MNFQKYLTAVLVCLIALASSVGYAATSSPSPNLILFTADEDTFTYPSVPVGNAAIIESIEVTPNTTGTLYQILNNTTNAVIWETTSTESRPITALGVVVTAVGGIAKITEKVNIQLPPGGIRFNTTTSAGAGFTGIYLRRRAPN